MKKTLCVWVACLMLSLCCTPFAVKATESELPEAKTEVQTEQTEEPVQPSEPMDWQAYIEDELLPTVTMVLTVIAGIYVAISPILAKIKKASEKFKSATEDVNAATGTVKSNEKKIEELEAVLSQKIGQMERENAANRKTILEIEQMLRLGLGNMNELVMKGCARSIVQIGQDIEQTLDGVLPQEERTDEA